MSSKIPDGFKFMPCTPHDGFTRLEAVYHEGACEVIGLVAYNPNGGGCWQHGMVCNLIYEGGPSWYYAGTEAEAKSALCKMWLKETGRTSQLHTDSSERTDD